MFPLGKIASLQRQEKLGVKSKSRPTRGGWSGLVEIAQQGILNTGQAVKQLPFRFAFLHFDLKTEHQPFSADCHTADAVPEVHSPSAQGRKASNSLEMQWRNAADAFSWPAPA
jgi:hypothetical protein